MKRIIVMTSLAVAASAAFAQTATVGQSSTTDSAATSGAMAIGGGAGTGTATLNNTIGGTTVGGSSSRNSNSARGGTGGTANNALSVSVYSGTDPSATGASAGTSAKDQSTGSASDPIRQDVHESIKTVGSPGSMSYGVSFSQYNCQSTAGVGAGFMGGAFQIGVGKESDPCNARANAAALFSIAQTLQSTNAPLSAQLYHAAILLIGNSTSATKEALAGAGVSDWATASTTTPTPAIVPPAPQPAPQDESKRAAPQPEVARVPVPEIKAEPLQVEQVKVPAEPVQAAPIPTVPVDEATTSKGVVATVNKPDDEGVVRARMFLNAQALK